MKKSIYLLLIAALTIGFAACTDKNEPSNDDGSKGGDDKIVIADLLGYWYLDSIKTSTGTTSHRQIVVRFVDDKTVIWGLGMDTCTYVTEDGKILVTFPKRATISGEPYVVKYIVIKGSKDYAVLQEKDEKGMIYYFQHLPSFDDSEIDISEASMAGEYEEIMTQMTDTYNGQSTVSYTFGSGFIMMWTLYSNGSLIMHDNTPTPTTWVWQLAPHRAFLFGPDASSLDTKTIYHFSANWLIFKTTSTTYDGHEREYLEYYLRMK